MFAGIVTTHVVRLKLFRLKAEGAGRARLRRFGGDTPELLPVNRTRKIRIACVHSQVPESEMPKMYGGIHLTQVTPIYRISMEKLRHTTLTS